MLSLSSFGSRSRRMPHPQAEQSTWRYGDLPAQGVPKSFSNGAPTASAPLWTGPAPPPFPYNAPYTAPSNPPAKYYPPQQKRGCMTCKQFWWLTAALVAIVLIVVLAILPFTVDSFDIYGRIDDNVSALPTLEPAMHPGLPPPARV